MRCQVDFGCAVVKRELLHMINEAPAQTRAPCLRINRDVHQMRVGAFK